MRGSISCALWSGNTKRPGKPGREGLRPPEESRPCADGRDAASGYVRRALAGATGPADTGAVQSAQRVVWIHRSLGWCISKKLYGGSSLILSCRVPCCWEPPWI
ncbi:hypothetical protein DESPIG_02853 [Desulfovibrio piger ATCC 29098]|uniref:Uncharacterized protein n=1 Tax=Desulfovibrio piger ATCC 29098 TaxID=411464 RepID=B6WXM7_9BACT|nr:hypothetical protein DESPIG_02853 [Desulfovibrio piger ATCC 29098]